MFTFTCKVICIPQMGEKELGSLVLFTFLSLQQYHFILMVQPESKEAFKCSSPHHGKIHLPNFLCHLRLMDKMFHNGMLPHPQDSIKCEYYCKIFLEDFHSEYQAADCIVKVRSRGAPDAGETEQ